MIPKEAQASEICADPECGHERKDHAWYLFSLVRIIRTSCDFCSCKKFKAKKEYNPDRVEIDMKIEEIKKLNKK